MKFYRCIFALFFGLFFSCTEMNIPPMNILSDKDIFTSEDGIQSYMARMYSTLPVEDFRYSLQNLFNLSNFYAQNPCVTGEAISRDVHGSAAEKVGYWDDAYKLIREANYFIETLPKYSSNFKPEQINRMLGEARFIRAFTYYALVKRYGGVPIVKMVLNYPEVSMEETKLFRDSEEDTWDFISEDLDFAIANLNTTSQKGRANKYVAAAMKSRIMLHAGTIAKYNQVSEVYEGKRICGIPSNRANDYFDQAYKASLIVDEAGVYGLYMGDWKANDKQSQYVNYVNLFLKETNENIFVKYYQYPTSVHSWDCVTTPTQLMVSGGSNTEICPTLDFVEMFEGFDKDANGNFANLDANGNYKLYGTTLEPFSNAEPRLRAAVLLPGDVYKNQVIEIWRGIYKGEVAEGIKPLLPVGAVGTYQAVASLNSVLALAANEDANDRNPYKLVSGEYMKMSGKSGMVNSSSKGCSVSGFLCRKYMDETTTNVGWHQSDQSWIEMRYAEVLLNRAEAAYELYSAGVATSGVDYRSVAFQCVNNIRKRAGATELAAAADLNSIDIVRNERRKELAFENKTYWDLKRWRVIDKEQNSKVYRVLMPFFADKANKFFMDIKLMERNVVYTFDTRQYYQMIPGGELSKNTNIKQNPGF